MASNALAFLVRIIADLGRSIPTAREPPCRRCRGEASPVRFWARVRCAAAAASVGALILAAAGCGHGGGTAADDAPSKPPVWAAQLAWSPSPASLQIDYNSSNTTAPVAGAYDSTASVFPSAHWQVHTWKLVDVAWGGRQNFSADLRLSAAVGVAVHQLVLSLRPPSHGEPRASVTLAAGPAAAALGPANVTHGLAQVGAGGNQGDSFYHTATVQHRSAEVLDQNTLAGAGAPSYLYFRLARTSPLFTAHPSVVYATVTFAALQPTRPWSEATFAKLAAKGIHRAEINLEWAAVEPAPGRFAFAVLDGDLANAAKAGVKVIPIFWYSVWAGNPAPWITKYDVGNNGTASQVPTWWSRFNRQSYFTYIKDTVAHIQGSPGFGGAFLDYGWLDYMWGPAPGGSGVNGYAPQDVARFHAWLPGAYASLRAFNRAEGTHYGAFAQVPAARPGQRLFGVYQHFRAWSVQETYSRLSALYRQVTRAPLYFYWGGGAGGFGTAFDLPDTFFQVAKHYHGTVVLDDADHTGLALIFTALARAYGVPLLEEWTPRPRGLHAEVAEFLGHYGFEFPERAGMDFFLYGGGREFQVGYPVYTRAIPLLKGLRGHYPLQPVAVYVSYRSIYHTPGALAGVTRRLAAAWRLHLLGFTVVTSAELAAGVTRLGDYRAVLPLEGSGAAVAAYARQGGHVVHTAAQLARYAPAYASLSPGTASRVEIVPTVDRSRRTAWLTVAGTNPTFAYQGRLTIHLAGLGLPAGTYHLVDVATGRAIPAQATRSGVTLPLGVQPGAFHLWRLEPGAGPRG